MKMDYALILLTLINCGVGLGQDHTDHRNTTAPSFVARGRSIREPKPIPRHVAIQRLTSSPASIHNLVRLHGIGKNTQTLPNKSLIVTALSQLKDDKFRDYVEAWNQLAVKKFESWDAPDVDRSFLFNSYARLLGKPDMIATFPPPADTISTTPRFGQYPATPIHRDKNSTTLAGIEAFDFLLLELTQMYEKAHTTGDVESQLYAARSIKALYSAVEELHSVDAGPKTRYRNKRKEWSDTIRALTTQPPRNAKNSDWSSGAANAPQ